MRREASLEEWRRLYEIGTKIGEMKLWESFWDMDLIGIEEGDPEDTAFISILGKGGSCYGIAVYEGYEGLNDFWMLASQTELNLTTEYAMLSQDFLACYWGNREELSKKQWEIVRELGYRYRGRNQWMYFMSYREGYIPYQMDREEVLRMTHYLELLEKATRVYLAEKPPVSFENGEMLRCVVDKENFGVCVEAAPLPFTMFQLTDLTIEDEEVEEILKNAPASPICLEIDLVYMGGRIDDPKYDRPASTRMYVVGEAASGMILQADGISPEENGLVTIAEALVGFIETFGAPKEVRVRSVLCKAVLEDLCRLAGVKLRLMKNLPACEEAIAGFQQRF